MSGYQSVICLTLSFLTVTLFSSNAKIFISLATRLLTRYSSIRSDSSKANLVGYTPSGLPLYNFHAAGTMLQRHSQSLIAIFKSNLRQILEGEDSRQIFYFLCMNLVSLIESGWYQVWPVFKLIFVRFLLLLSCCMEFGRIVWVSFRMVFI